MKLTRAEYRLLDALDCIDCATLNYFNLRPWAKAAAQDMCDKGLIKKRAFYDGYVVATALGKRAHSYGKR